MVLVLEGGKQRLTASGHEDLIEVTELLLKLDFGDGCKIQQTYPPPPKSLNYTVKMGNFHGMQITLQ